MVIKSVDSKCEYTSCCSHIIPFYSPVFCINIKRANITQQLLHFKDLNMFLCRKALISKYNGTHAPARTHAHTHTHTHTHQYINSQKHTTPSIHTLFNWSLAWPEAASAKLLPYRLWRARASWENKLLWSVWECARVCECMHDISYLAWFKTIFTPDSVNFLTIFVPTVYKAALWNLGKCTYFLGES